MRFLSTRGKSSPVSFCEAVSQGLAPDGGLYLPQEYPSLLKQIPKWGDLDYTELCYEFFRFFATDLDGKILKNCVETAYSGFNAKETAPLINLSENWKVLELFHGPTLAFKDFALQLLGNLYEAQIEREQQPLCILGATSGDTGAAAISGLLGKQGVTVFILYPKGKVSPLQEMQMTRTGASNVYPIAIEGTFDDAQKTVKELFADLEFRKKVHLSAVNSINLARILAQSVYYLHAYLRLPQRDRKDTTFAVPTGNFGNVFAGWLLTKMEVEISEYRVATNQNDVLHRLFTSGQYSLGAVEPSVAPSMDIQVASNFERLLYYVLDGNPKEVTEVMNQFRRKGRYDFENLNLSEFSSASASDDEIPDLIRLVYQEHGYLVDPHTACAFKDLNPLKKAIILATAHPAKFPSVYEQAGIQVPVSPVLDALVEKPAKSYEISVSADAIRSFILDCLQ